jgi:zinc/manganese transport system substrate-binding protein
MMRHALAAAVLTLAVALPAAAADLDRGSVVVTTDVLGALASELVGDDAELTVLMEGGVDPHSWQPSARDSEAVFRADLVVANGSDLEEGLVDVLAQAESDGVPVFYASDRTLPLDSDALDPHIWLDPMAMRDVVLALGPALSAVGIDAEARTQATAADLAALDAELVDILARVPEPDRRLVTGHGALGYFADRYGFEIVGTVVPGLSSSDEPSAREVAQLIEDIRAAGATVVFTDVGTPDAVARAVADETDADVVELSVAVIPAGGGYPDLMRELAMSVAEALSRS